MQLALSVDKAIAFYTALLGTPPAQVRLSYADFAVASPPRTLVLLENPGAGGTINHLGVEVPSTEKVHRETARLTGKGLFTDREMGTTCCFATQDKVLVTGPRRRAVRGLGRPGRQPDVRHQPQTLIEAGRAPDSGVCCGTAAGSDSSCC